MPRWEIEAPLRLLTPNGRGVVLVVQEQGASCRVLSAATSRFALRAQHKVRGSKNASPDCLAGPHPPNSHERFMGQLDTIWE